MASSKWMAGRRAWIVLGVIGLTPFDSVQAQDPTFQLNGIVTDTAGAPIPLVQVIVLGTKGKTRGPHQTETSESGRFVIPGLGEGEYAVTVRRLGYVPMQVMLNVKKDPLPTLEFELVPIVQRLRDVLAEVPSLRPDPEDARALFRGIVVDTAGQPIELAEILAGGDRPRTRGPSRDETNARGLFGFPGLRAGRYFVTVRRIGYIPIRVALTFEDGRHRTVRFEMYPMPQNLPDVVVEAQMVNMMRVARRVGAYQGKLVTRDEIAAADPEVLGDVLEEYLFAVDPQTFFEPSLGFDFETVRSVRFGLGPRNRATDKAFLYQGNDCPPVISLNGRRATVGWAINDINPAEIEAMEVYRRRDSTYIPLEFRADLVLRRSCGSLVVIWLKGGNNRLAP